MNVVALIGRLVADPELKYTPAGIAVCKLRIAVDRRFKNEAGEKQTDFFDVVAWRQSAEFASQYLAKGQRVAVQGSLQQRSWVQQDGQKRSAIEVVADNLQGMDKPNAAPDTRERLKNDLQQPEQVMDEDPFEDE